MSAVKTENAFSIGASTITEVRTAVSDGLMVTSPPPVALNDGSERCERVGPKTFEVGPHLGQPLRIQLIKTPCSLGSVHDQAGFLEHFEVLGYRRPRDSGAGWHPTAQGPCPRSSKMASRVVSPRATTRHVWLAFTYRKVLLTYTRVKPAHVDREGNADFGASVRLGITAHQDRSDRQ